MFRTITNQTRLLLLWSRIHATVLAKSLLSRRNSTCSFNPNIKIAETSSLPSFAVDGPKADKIDLDVNAFLFMKFIHGRDVELELRQNFEFASPL